MNLAHKQWCFPWFWHDFNKCVLVGVQNWKVNWILLASFYASLRRATWTTVNYTYTELLWGHRWHRHEDDGITVRLTMSFWHSTSEGSHDVTNHMSLVAMLTYRHLHGVEWVAMGSYSHGKGLKSQLTNGVELVIRYGNVSVLCTGNSSWVSPETG
jgi:hypothetical protein